MWTTLEYYSAPNSTRQPNDAATSIANRGDAMQGTFNPGSIILPERPDVSRHIVYVGWSHQTIRHHFRFGGIAGFRRAPEITDDFEQALKLVLMFQPGSCIRRQNFE